MTETASSSHLLASGPSCIWGSSYLTVMWANNISCPLKTVECPTTCNRKESQVMCTKAEMKPTTQLPINSTVI